MGIDQTIDLKLNRLFNENNLRLLLEQCKKLNYRYQYRLKFDCEQNCKDIDPVLHTLLCEEKPDEHDPHSFEIQVNNLWFWLLLLKSEDIHLELIFTPSAGNPMFDYLGGQYGFPLDKYISEIIVPLVDPFCIETIQITQYNEPLALSDTMKSPYIVGYASMGENNFTQAHVKILVGNILESGITILDKNHTPLAQQAIQDRVLYTLEKHEVEYLDANFQGKNFKIGLGDDKEGNIKIIPEQPYRMKNTAEETCIDLAFYVERVLDIAEGFYLYGLNTSGF